MWRPTPGNAGGKRVSMKSPITMAARGLRRSRPWLALCRAACFILLLPVSGPAASRSLAPGQVLGISEDVVLAGDDVLEVNGTAERPCRIDANWQQSRAAPDWRG